MLAVRFGLREHPVRPHDNGLLVSKLWATRPLLERGRLVSGWGNNPQTYQTIAQVITAVGVVALIAATLIARSSLTETRRQRLAAEEERALRVRPWVGMFGMEFQSEDRNMLKLDIRNFGLLPAQRACFSIELKPAKVESNEKANGIVWSEDGEKVLLPTEVGNYRLDLSHYPQFALWRESGRDVSFTAKYSYGIGLNNFQTDIQGTLWLSGTSPNGRDLNWRNVSAT